LNPTNTTTAPQEREPLSGDPTEPRQGVSNRVSWKAEPASPKFKGPVNVFQGRQLRPRPRDLSAEHQFDEWEMYLSREASTPVALVRTGDKGGGQSAGNCASFSEGASLNLLPHHLQELRASGLRDETIRAAGIFSATDRNRIAEILNWQTVAARMSSGLVFPFRDGNGPNGYARIKPDHPRRKNGRVIKYESPRGRSNELYVPPNTFAALTDPTVLLLITEGEKKSLAADQHGMACLGLVGVYGWKDASGERMLPALERVAWRNREVVIVFDSDVRHNPDNQTAETRLAAILTRRGAHVRVARLPDGPVGEDGRPTKLGLDDFIVAHGLEALRAVLSTAEVPAEPDSTMVKVPAKSLDPCREVGAFIDLRKTNNVSRLRFWRGAWYHWENGYYQELSREEVQSQLVAHLNDVAFQLTTTVIGNHMAQLKAQTILSDSISAPAWLGTKPLPWAGNEIMACRNTLVHLPSLVANRDYACAATPLYFSTVALDYDFSPTAPRPDAWLAFLDQLWPGDSQSIATLQQWFGYSLVVDTRQQKILMLIGPRRSGKGTIARVLRQLVGAANVAGPTLASLGTNFGLWPLLDKSLAIISDARLGNRTDSSIVVERLLSISGEDALTVDRKHQEPVTTKLNTRLMLLTNELPRLTDSSGALAGRMLLLRLTQSWFGHEDHGVFTRLQQELPGILLWAIQGWQRLRDQGHFTQPTTTAELHRDLDDLTSPVGAFIREQCVQGPDHTVLRKTLFDAYRRWCQEAGRARVEDAAGFGRNLRAVLPSLGGGWQGSGSTRERTYEGIALQVAGAGTG